jgi:hypothetical protein
MRLRVSGPLRPSHTPRPLSERAWRCKYTTLHHGRVDRRDLRPSDSHHPRDEQRVARAV